MKYYFSLLVLFYCINLNAQVVTTIPQYPTEDDSIIVYFDAAKGNAGLKGFTGDVYAHTGVITDLSANSSDWKYVMAPWTANYPDTKLIRDGGNPDRYYLVIGRPRTYYSNNHQNLGAIPLSEHILKLAFVFRNSTGTLTGRDTGGKDIFSPIYTTGISILLNSPSVNVTFGDPARSPYCAVSGSTVRISAKTTQAGITTLFINGMQKAQSTVDSISYDYTVNDYPVGLTNIKITAIGGANYKDSVQFAIMRNPPVRDLPPPEGCKAGINYGDDPAKITLALFAPKKNFIYVIGEFGNSDWKVDTSYFMNRCELKTDSVIWWKTITNLEPGKEYAYQFLVDNNLRIYDPYTEKILDPDNDRYISSAVYPNLKQYPAGKTSGYVSVLQTGQASYSWQAASFTPPLKEKLVIYELLVRDFVGSHSYKTITDTIGYFKKLGINAIELMPVMEFEGNSSWGYNPATYFAPDKYYGTKNDLKTLIDACHKNGIAVILDIVLNHASNSNSMARLYWDETYNRPAADNPWFNTTSPNTYYSYGNDFNHESKDTKYFVDRVTSFWLSEYKVDGFRFDFTKGFTNTPGEGTAYDASRIAILKRIASRIWSVSPGAYVILEHFCANSEEMELANYGLMLWGNNNYNYCEAAMGYISTSNFINISYKQKGWGTPNLVGYMESHDEERLMYKNIAFGNSSGTYNIKDISVALSRIELAAALFVLVPGPKMIWQFGDFGYDVSKFADINGVVPQPYGAETYKLDPKPLKWDYYNYIGIRRKLFNTFASLIKLKKEYEAFSTTDFVLNASGEVKSLYINHFSMNAIAIGNFDIAPQQYQPAFQSSGKWYEFFSGDSLTVSGANPSFTLQPGEYRLYTSRHLTKTDILTDTERGSSIPREYSLNQNYPNPFNPGTIITYKLPVSGRVILKVYDLLGREITELVNEYQNAGIHTTRFSSSGLCLTSGVYFYRLQSGNYTAVKKMILIK